MVSGPLQALVGVGTSQVIGHGLHLIQVIQNENGPFGVGDSGLTIRSADPEASADRLGPQRIFLGAGRCAIVCYGPGPAAVMIYA
jgi:hypothetical protein